VAALMEHYRRLRRLRPSDRLQALEVQSARSALAHALILLGREHAVAPDDREAARMRYLTVPPARPPGGRRPPAARGPRGAGEG
jgi:hypothetical protein